MLEMDALAITLTGVLVAAVLYLWCGHRKIQLMAKIPRPPGVPFIGMMFEGMCPLEELHLKFIKYAMAKGPVVNISIPGSYALYISGPDEIQTVLCHQTNIRKGWSYSFLKKWLATGLLTGHGDKWRSRRKMMNPAFHYKILEDFVPVFNANSAILVETLGKQIENEEVEIADFVTLCTLDIICETVMGTSVNAQKGGSVEYIRAVKRMCELMALRCCSPWFFPDIVWYLSPHGREEKRRVKVLKDFSGNVIKERRLELQQKKGPPGDSEQGSESKKRLSFLDLLLDMTDERGQLTDEDIGEEVDTFMFAGHDTTASAISWTFLLLANHQQVQEKVYLELLDIFGSDDRQPTATDINTMTYLDMVIKESLRLFPSVPIFARQTDVELKLGDYIIPAGVDLLLSSYLVHRNRDAFPDPEKFNPDRFLPEESSRRHPFSYVPFSAGLRSCIGQKFARLEEKSVLSAILRKFRLEPGTMLSDIILVPAVVLNPKTPIKIKLSPRV